MRPFIHGNDRGNTVLLSLVLILTLSLLFLSLMPRVIAVNRYAREYKAKVIQEIQNANREVLIQYDLH